MQPQYTLDENKQPVKEETTSTLINVEEILSELKMIDNTLTKTQARKDFLLNELTLTQQIPNIDTKIISKIQELPEFAATPVTINETKI